MGSRRRSAARLACALGAAMAAAAVPATAGAAPDVGLPPMSCGAALAGGGTGPTGGVSGLATMVMAGVALRAWAGRRRRF